MTKDFVVITKMRVLYSLSGLGIAISSEPAVFFILSKDKISKKRATSAE
jgi:hypothetical protein